MAHFIHTADWQIGRQYGQFDDEDAAFLAQARLDVVATIAQVATERGVDAVLVAGDVFDTQGVSDRTIRRLFAAMAGFSGPWVMIPGNHDAALVDSVWTRAQSLGCMGPNVHPMLQPGVFELPHAGAWVLAAPLTQRHTYDDVTAGFDLMDTPADRVRIGLAHGSVSGQLAESIDASNPIAPDRASVAKLDYLALGDWHGVMEIGARTWYSGTPEPDRFRNNESGVVLDVEIDSPGAIPRVTPISVGRYRWQQWQVRLDLHSDVEALIHKLDGLEASDVLRLELEGTLTVADWDRLQRALDQASARVLALRLEASAIVLMPDHEDLAALNVDGYVGVVASELQTMQQDPNTGAIAREALRVLMQFQRDATRGVQGGQ